MSLPGHCPFKWSPAQPQGSHTQHNTTEHAVRGVNLHRQEAVPDLYTFANFVADFGGYLGLLLGHSLLSLYDIGKEIVFKMILRKTY